MTQQIDAIVSDEVASEDVVRKKVDELSLDEIKAELEKRSLDSSGDDYAILHERLTDSMIEEGLDPAVYEFEFDPEDDDEEEEADEETSVAEEEDHKQQQQQQVDTKSSVAKRAGDANVSTKKKDQPVGPNNNNNSSSSKNKAANSNNDSITISIISSTDTKTNNAVASSNNNNNNKTPTVSEKDEQPVSREQSPTSEEPQYKEVPGNHLWVSGVSSRCKAANLKKFFARHANVSSAKVVANAKTSSAHCYGYITVESTADLETCVRKLHGVRFEGYAIRVQPCKLAPADQLRKVEMKNRERLAQQKEEIRKRSDERMKKIDEEKKRRGDRLRHEERKRQEHEKAQKDDRRKHDSAKHDEEHRRKHEHSSGRREEDLKRDHNKKDDLRKPWERRKSRSRSPHDRRRDDLHRRHDQPPLHQRSPPRKLKSPPHELYRRRTSPFNRTHERRVPSPFARGPMPAPFVHAPVGFRPPLGRGRIVERDHRLEEQRLELDRRQRAEAEALIRERRQLRMEEERLEREKLDLIRLERERVKKEMEEVAARKEMAERRRREELRRQQEEDRKREEMRLELERRPREPPRPQLPPQSQQPMELYDSRLPMPVDEYSRNQNEDKFAGRLGPPLQRDLAPRHDDRRRDDRRREPPPVIMGRDDRRPPELLDPWNAAAAAAVDSKVRGDYLDQPSRHDSQMPLKRMRSRSPQRPPGGNSGYGALSPAEYGFRRTPAGGDSWPPQGSRSQMGSSPSSGFLDSRRPLPPPVTSRSVDAPPPSSGQWPSNGARVAFPPAYGHPEPLRGLLGSSSSISTSAFGLGSLQPSIYRRV